MEPQEIHNEITQTFATFKEYVDKRVEETNGRIDTMQAKAAYPGGGKSYTESIAQEDRALLGPQQKCATSAPALPDGIKPSEISLGRVLKGIALGDWRGADAERRIVTFKALGGVPDTAGGYVLPDMVSAQIIDLARARSTFIRAGGRTLPIADGRMALPKLTGDPTGYWKGENREGTFSDLTFGRINLNPQTLMILVKSSVELLEDAGDKMGAFIDGVFAQALATEIDRVCYLGNGTSEPTGIWNTDGLNTVAGGGALSSYDKFLDAAQKIYEANYGGGFEGLSVIMPARTQIALAKLKEGTTNAPLAPPPAFAQMQKFATTQASTTLGAGSNESMVLEGDFTQAALVVRTGVTLEATRQAGEAFRDLQVWFRGYVRVDVAVMRPTFFTKITGVTN